VTGRPHEPTSPPGRSVVQGRGDAPPPSPPHELSPETGESREFEAEGSRWVARLAGKGASGTGSYGLGLIDAVHFCAADRPDRPLREALLARGRFELLYDSELAALLAGAKPITTRRER
jgi:hypothetical protein